MGVPNTGGSVVTRGGLAFIGASQDRGFRAYDVTTGQELWQAKLPGGACEEEVMAIAVAHEAHDTLGAA